MGFFDYFFESKKEAKGIHIQFGRFSDAYKDEEKYDAWDRSLELFDEKEYLESYRKFFHYLSDESANNLMLSDEGGKLHFELFQGSKKITGSADGKKFQAEAKIAKTDALHIGFLRRLLEDNYHLKYCRHALDRDNNITMVFATDTIDGSPYKLYYALKELATHADKKDDVLISEFDDLKPINTRHIRQIKDEEIQIKFNYVIEEIDKVLERIDNSKLNISQYPGAESYVYLDLIYRIDYLVKPEGDIMEIIDKIHNLYFHNKLKSADQKNRTIRRELKKIRATSYEAFKSEIYEVKSTFGVTQPSGLTRIQEFIDSEVKNMDWYCQNSHDKFALAIPSYIVGYSLFNYSMPAPMRDLFNLYYQVVQGKFFLDIGIKDQFKNGDKLNASKLKKEVKSIVNRHQKDYPEMEADAKSLLFDDDCLFAKTFLMMIKKMNFTRKDHR